VNICSSGTPSSFYPAYLLLPEKGLKHGTLLPEVGTASTRLLPWPGKQQHRVVASQQGLSPHLQVLLICPSPCSKSDLWGNTSVLPWPGDHYWALLIFLSLSHPLHMTPGLRDTQEISKAHLWVYLGDN
jgi:hypothetical protein